MQTAWVRRLLASNRTLYAGSYSTCQVPGYSDVRAMKENIHVYAAEPDTLRADHTLRVWGRVFLRLHYRMVRKQCKPPVTEVSGVQAGAP